MWTIEGFMAYQLSTKLQGWFQIAVCLYNNNTAKYLKQKQFLLNSENEHAFKKKKFTLNIRKDSLFWQKKKVNQSGQTATDITGMIYTRQWYYWHDLHKATYIQQGNGRGSFEWGNFAFSIKYDPCISRRQSKVTPKFRGISKIPWSGKCTKEFFLDKLTYSFWAFDWSSKLAVAARFCTMHLSLSTKVWFQKEKVLIL